MSVPVPNRSESPAQFLQTAYEIDMEVVSLHRKKYFEDVRDTILKEMYSLSSSMLTCLIRADDLYAVELKGKASNDLIVVPMVQERFRLFNEAKGYLAALSNKATELYIVKPVKQDDFNLRMDRAIGILLATEYKLVKGLCDSEKERLKKYAKNM